MTSQGTAHSRFQRAIHRRHVHCEQDAQRALEDCLRDEPHWEGLLRVETIELSADKSSLK